MTELVSNSYVVYLACYLCLSS